LSQSVLILGSTDFLGNPNGFINDISKGFSGLVSDGDVSGLIKNVAHGAANSAAKGITMRNQISSLKNWIPFSKYFSYGESLLRNK